LEILYLLCRDHPKMTSTVHSQVCCLSSSGVLFPALICRRGHQTFFC